MESPLHGCRKEAQDVGFRPLEDRSKDMGTQPGQGTGGLHQVHSERYRLWSVKLPHPYDNGGQAERHR